jgi:malonyl CoA-acyl carrier protein transacylase/acyl carrier protein
VNAFGFGGINAHAILEECAAPDRHEALDGGPPWESEVVTLHASSRRELIDFCNRVQGFTERAVGPELCDLAYTINCGGNSDGKDGVCLALVVSSIDDFRRKLSYSIQRLSDPGCRMIRDASGIFYFEQVLGREGKTAFLFPGEGAQYLNMFADLCMRLAPVRERFDLIDRAFTGHERGWLPSQVIFPPPLPNDAETRRAQQRHLEEMDFAAEAVFAASQGMLALLRDLDIRADMVAGHSGGETSALLAAGVIRTAGDHELVRHITDLNHLFLRLSREGFVPGGSAFAVSGAEREAVLQAIRDSGRRFEIGMDNCPHQVVLCGNEASADGLLTRLRAAGALCTPLPFQRPYHTPAFEPYCVHVRPFFDRLEIGAAQVPVYCGSTARPFPEDPDEIRRLAARQTALPVRFRETIEAMYLDGARVFLEVGPKGTLISFVSDTLRSRPHVAIASDLPQVKGTHQLNLVLAQLAAHGVPMRLQPLYERRGAKLAPLDGTAASAAPRKPGMRLVTGLPRLRLSEQNRVWKTPAPSSPPVAIAPQPVTVAAAGVSAGAFAHGAATTAAMHAYLRSMDQFLAVQQDVMQAYFGRSHSSPAPQRPAGPPSLGIEDTVQQTVHPAARSSQEPGVKPVPSNGFHTNGNGKLHRTPMAILVEVISERTGYPIDLLEPALNLEADLGIDSIKRVEILGELHRHTGLIGPGRMEHVSSLKTLREIAAYLDGAQNTKPEPPPAAPLTMAGRTVSLEPGVKHVCLREFGLARDLFLQDHALGGRVSTSDPSLTGLPLIPLTMTMELMAQAASRVLPEQTLIEMCGVRGLQWLALDDARLTLRTVATRSGEREVRVEVQTQSEDIVAEGTAIFADGYPDPHPVPELQLVSSRASAWTPERLYRDHMFHGPCFRAIESIDRWGENGLIATLVSLPASGLFLDCTDPELLTDPVIADAAGQMIGYWAAEHLATGFNVFPYRIQSLKLYGPRLTEGLRARCQMRIRLATESQFHADLDVLDAAGRGLMRIEGWEDIRVDMPDRFYRACISPRRVFLSSPRSINSTLCLCSARVSEFPSLTAQGGIWVRALAHVLLDAAERQAWR